MRYGVANFTYDLSDHPDFSQSGAPINFGFWAGNSGSGVPNMEAGIDNWIYTIQSEALTSTAPEAGQTIMMIGGALALLAVVGRRVPSHA